MAFKINRCTQSWLLGWAGTESMRCWQSEAIDLTMYLAVVTSWLAFRIRRVCTALDPADPSTHRSLYSILVKYFYIYSAVHVYRFVFCAFCSAELVNKPNTGTFPLYLPFSSSSWSHRCMQTNFTDAIDLSLDWKTENDWKKTNESDNCSDCTY